MTKPIFGSVEFLEIDNPTELEKTGVTTDADRTKCLKKEHLIKISEKYATDHEGQILYHVYPSNNVIAGIKPSELAAKVEKDKWAGLAIPYVTAQNATSTGAPEIWVVGIPTAFFGTPAPNAQEQQKQIAFYIANLYFLIGQGKSVCLPVRTKTNVLIPRPPRPIDDDFGLAADKEYAFGGGIAPNFTNQYSYRFEEELNKLAIFAKKLKENENNNRAKKQLIENLGIFKLAFQAGMDKANENCEFLGTYDAFKDQEIMQKFPENFFIPSPVAPSNTPSNTSTVKLPSNLTKTQFENIQHHTLFNELNFKSNGLGGYTGKNKKVEITLQPDKIIFKNVENIDELQDSARKALTLLLAGYYGTDFESNPNDPNRTKLIIEISGSETNKEALEAVCKEELFQKFITLKASTNDVTLKVTPAASKETSTEGNPTPSTTTPK